MIPLSRDTEALAYRLAQAKGVPVAEAVAEAIAASARGAGLAVPRDTSPAGMARRHASPRRIAAEIAALPVVDRRSPAEIMDDLDPL